MTHTLVAKKVAGIYFTFPCCQSSSDRDTYVSSQKVAGIYFTLPCCKSSFDRDTYVSSQKGCWYLFNIALLSEQL